MSGPAPDLPANMILIGGATAIGKSAVALCLAERLTGEIISVDSMQVYRGMDIGTAKPTPAQRRLVRHHLVDVAALHESFDAARFAAMAAAAARDIAARGNVPIGCGGTGLYFKALLEGVGSAPPAQAALRKELEGLPLEDLLRELQTSDPETWNRIDRKNKRRIVRALEVIRLSARPFSQQRDAWSKAPHAPPQAGRFFLLRRDPADLRARIDARVDHMFAEGLVEETARLLSAGLAENPTALQAIGYRQVVEHLQGIRPLNETIALVKQRTRHFAKHQLTWFRHQAAATWLDIPNAEAPEATAERVMAKLDAPAS